MKLSEAGLLGNMATDVITGRLMIDNKTCFLGGALLAVGAIQSGTLTAGDEEKTYDTLYKLWPILMKVVPTVFKPIHDGQVIGLIWYVNDTLHWTRPKIAQLVKQVEEYYTPHIPEASTTVEEHVASFVTTKP